MVAGFSGAWFLLLGSPCVACLPSKGSRVQHLEGSLSKSFGWFRLGTEPEMYKRVGGWFPWLSWGARKTLQ